MKSSVDIDEKLLREAMRCSGASTKKETVEAALRLLVETYAQTSIRRLRGKVWWEGDLDRSRRQSQESGRAWFQPCREGRPQGSRL